MAHYYLHRFLEADKIIKKLEHENEMLKNRCAVMGEGQLCQFCPFDCENRSKKYRGQME